MELPVTSSAIVKAAVGPGACLDGEGLLNDLRGNNGLAMRSVAIGYVKGLLDAAPGLWAHAMPSSIEGPSLEQAIARIEAWLAANEGERRRAAPEVIREALGWPARAARTAKPVAGFAMPGWFRYRRALAAAIVGMGLVAALVFRIAPGGVGGASSQFARAEALKEQTVLIAGLMLQERRFEKDLFINIGSRDRIEDYVHKWNDARQRLQGELDRAEALALSAEDRDDLRRIQGDLRIYVGGYESVLARIRAGQIATPEQANDEFERYKSSAHRAEMACAAIYQRISRVADAPLGST